MFYFIPSWYGEEKQWYQEIPTWFEVFEHLTFNDTLSQLKMFQLSDEPVSLIHLSYQPHFRYFLHKHELQLLPYWSFFDDIQNCHLQSTCAIHFKELSWPRGTQFLYTPFKVLAKLKNQVLADIHFAENGNLFYIQTYCNQREDRRYIFDDRGFLSSLVTYDCGHKLYQDYLNPNGVWQVREWFNRDKNVLEINPLSDRNFQKKSYDCWEDLIQERLTVFEQRALSNDDVVVVDADLRHNQFLLPIFERQKKVLSYSKKPYRAINKEDLSKIARLTSVLVTDDKNLEEDLIKELKEMEQSELQVMAIPPFDTRLRLGRSQTMKEQIIYYLIDGLSEEDYQVYLDVILNKMVLDKDLRLKIITYDSHCQIEQLQGQLLADLRATNRIEHFISKEAFLGENQLDEEVEESLETISFLRFSNEHQIINCLDTARLILDFSESPNLYTQIAGISAGIPQINRVATDYVVQGENGWIVEQPNQLRSVLDYYLDNLGSWNRSLVYSIQKMSDYTSGRLIEQWKELLERKSKP